MQRVRELTSARRKCLACRARARSITASISNWTSATSNRASPARSGRRTGSICRELGSAFRSSARQAVAGRWLRQSRAPTSANVIWFISMARRAETAGTWFRPIVAAIRASSQATSVKRSRWSPIARRRMRARDRGEDREVFQHGQSRIGHGSVLIAAITSCTNTSNPERDARRRSAGQESGGTRPNDRSGGEDFARARARASSPIICNKTGLQTYLDQLGFKIVGYGCTTCIGNSGPLHPTIEKAISRLRSRRRVACCPATAISRRACIRTSRRTSSCRRRSSSLLRSPAGWTRPAKEPLGTGQGRPRRLPEGPLADVGRNPRP